MGRKPRSYGNRGEGRHSQDSALRESKTTDSPRMKCLFFISLCLQQLYHPSNVLVTATMLMCICFLMHISPHRAETNILALCISRRSSWRDLPASLAPSAGHQALRRLPHTHSHTHARLASPDSRVKSWHTQDAGDGRSRAT